MNGIRVVREVSRVAPLPTRMAGAGEGRRHPLAIPVVPACTAFLWGALSLTAFSQPTAAVGGSIRDSSSGKPVAEVQVIAHSLNKHADRATVSNTNGVYMFINLEPGAYEFEATKDGFQKSSARAQIGDLDVATVDLPLQHAIDSPGTAEKPNEPPLTEREREMLERIDGLEQRLAAMQAMISAIARAQQPEPGQLAAGPPQPGIGNILETRPLVASLDPAAPMAGTAPSAGKSQAPATLQNPTPQQAGGKSGPKATPPTPVAPPSRGFRKPWRPPNPLPNPTTLRRSRTGISVGSMEAPGPETPYSTRNSSLRKFASIRITWPISTNPSTTPSSAPPNPSALAKSR